MTSSITGSTTASTVVVPPVVPPVVATSSSSSSSSSSAAITTAASTSTVPVNPVTVAQKSLFRSAKDNLWEEKITNSGWFTYLTGIALLSYLYNRSTAVASDKAFGATIVDINNKAVALVNAVASRRLSTAEATTRNLPGVQFANAGDQAKFAASLQQAETAEKAFYDVFKTRCTQLGVNLNDASFGVHSNAALAHLDSLVENRKPVRKDEAPVELMPQKMDTVKTGFGKRIYQDMVNAYANQPIDNITVDSYKQAIANISGFFKDNSAVDIEASLRQALKAKHDQAFNLEGNAYVDPALNNPKRAAIKAELSAKFIAERDALDAELAALRGPAGNNGTINEAYTRRQAAQAALDAAKAAFVAAFNTAFGGVTVTTPVETLAALDLGTFPADLQTAKTTLLEKVAEHKARDQEFNALMTKLGELATFSPADGVTLTGGKVKVARDKLVAITLDGEATAAARKIGNFYRELNAPVTEQNKQARYNRMHHADVIGA